MSADLMLVSSKQKQNSESNSSDCVQIDETSMGEPWTDFGKMMRASDYQEITDELIAKVEHWFDVLEHGSYDIQQIIKWLKDHKGENLEMEGW